MGIFYIAEFTGIKLLNPNPRNFERGNFFWLLKIGEKRGQKVIFWLLKAEI